MRVLKIMSLHLFVACKGKHDTSSGVKPPSSLVHSLQPALGLSRLNAQILRLISLERQLWETALNVNDYWGTLTYNFLNEMFHRGELENENIPLKLILVHVHE